MCRDYERERAWREHMTRLDEEYKPGSANS